MHPFTAPNRSIADNCNWPRPSFDDKAEVGVFGLTARKESLKIYKIAACQVTHECRQSVASVAGVALSHGINANIVHRWLRKPTQCALVQAPAGQ